MFHVIGSLVDDLLPTTWPMVAFALVVSLLGGHGLFITLFKHKKEQAQATANQISALMSQITDLSRAVGNNEGKIELLEKQMDRMRKEKHKFRNMAHKYMNLYTEMRHLKEAVEAERDRLRSLLKISPDSPLHAVEEEK